MFKDYKKIAGTATGTDTLIGQGTLAEGKLVCEVSLRVEGEYHGEIDCRGEVIIGLSGTAKANIEAHDVTVAGKVYGDVKTSGKLTITPAGQVHGNVTAGALIIQDGGTLNGECRMEKKPETMSRPQAAEEPAGKNKPAKEHKAKQAG